MREETKEEMENVNKNCEDIKGILRSLEKEAREKHLKLKGLKIETQNQIHINEQFIEEMEDKEGMMLDLKN